MKWIAGGFVLCACLATALAFAGGCAITGCDDAGCDDGVALETPTFGPERHKLLTLRACVEGKCAEERADFSAGAVAVDVPENRDDVSVTFTVRDDEGHTLLNAQGPGRVEVIRPNGDSCPPECRLVRVRFAGGRLLPAES